MLTKNKAFDLVVGFTRPCKIDWSLPLIGNPKLKVQLSGQTQVDFSEWSDELRQLVHTNPAESLHLTQSRKWMLLVDTSSLSMTTKSTLITETKFHQSPMQRWEDNQVLLVLYQNVKGTCAFVRTTRYEDLITGKNQTDEKKGTMNLLPTESAECSAPFPLHKTSLSRDQRQLELATY